jgi:hypothetical protein
MSFRERDQADIEHDRVQNLAERLKDDFPELPEQTVAETVDREYHHLDDTPIRDFVPVLVEHNAKAALKDQ